MLSNMKDTNDDYKFFSVVIFNFLEVSVWQTTYIITLLNYRLNLFHQIAGI